MTKGGERGRHILPERRSHGKKQFLSETLQAQAPRCNGTGTCRATMEEHGGASTHTRSLGTPGGPCFPAAGSGHSPRVTSMPELTTTNCPPSPIYTSVCKKVTFLKQLRLMLEWPLTPHSATYAHACQRTAELPCFRLPPRAPRPLGRPRSGSARCRHGRPFFLSPVLGGCCF